MAETNVAEEAAKANALAQADGKTTVEDMLANYAIKTVTLKSGRVFDIESFHQENVMLNLTSPLVMEFIEEANQNGDVQDLYHTRVPSAVTGPIYQLVAAHVTSVPVSMQPQSQCSEGVVSINQFTLDEIRELFKEMCVLSGVL